MGKDILEKGGNAVDATITTVLCNGGTFEVSVFGRPETAKVGHMWDACLSNKVFRIV